MKKFGRQGQYYQDKNQGSDLENNDLYENQSWNYDYEDPVDLEFLNEFQQKLNDYNFNSNTKLNQKNNKNIYNTPKFSSSKYNNSSSYYRNDNNSSNNVRYFRLSELNDNNPYNCLEVSQLSTEEEIRKAYKKLIIINHPDKGGDPEQFNRIHEAYQMLSNPMTKKIIDTFGSMSLDLVRNIINNDLIKSNQLKEDINFCIQQNDYPQLYFLLNNIKT
jgi:hypothetical protein